MATPSTIFELIPQKLIFGGAALGYYDGRAVLVPNALPGERLEVERLRESRGIVHARVRRVVSPSPARVQPPCPYFGDCGGCSYQHLAYENQIAWKVAIFRETLRRIGKLTWESEIAVHSAYPWYYRNQARLKIGSGAEKKIEIGFFANESHRLVKIDACRILSPRLNATVADLSRMGLCTLFEGVSTIEMMVDDCDRSVMLEICGRPRHDRGEQLAKRILAQLSQVQTVSFEADGKRWTLGKRFLTYRVGEFGYQISPGSFFQASRFLLPELVRVVAGTGSASAGDRSFARSVQDQDGATLGTDRAGDTSSCALDLYAGVGLFTLPLARQFNQVVAVESHSGSAADLVANTRAGGIENIRSVNQSVFEFLRQFGASEPDFVVLDPPRAGVGFPTLELLAQLGPRRICYVSCHPPTLARDLSSLAQRGYAVTAVDLFDFFPQTLHMESVTRLQRRDSLPCNL